jgi:hypothetical protein
MNKRKVEPWAEGLAVRFGWVPLGSAQPGQLYGAALLGNPLNLSYLLIALSSISSPPTSDVSWREEGEAAGRFWELCSFVCLGKDPGLPFGVLFWSF